MQWATAAHGRTASSNHHWGYPALLQMQRDVWVLLTEAGIERRQSASSLKNDAEPDRYRVSMARNELALTVLFESGLQHLADKPESYLAQPQEVQCFLSGLPAAWDETRLVTGYPGEEAVIARRKDDTWYVAGINGTDSEREIKTELSFLGKGTWRLVSFFDGDDGQQPWLIADVPEASLPSSVRCRPRGGFVLKLRKN